MRDLFRLIGWTVVDLFRSRAALEAEIWTLRQQINVLRRTAPKRLSFSVVDHLVFVGLYRLFPKICDALAIVNPPMTATGISLPEAERSIASSSNARGACDREVLATKHNQALRMKARLLSFGFSLLLQPQNMCA
jgi:hypothetical protein